MIQIFQCHPGFVFNVSSGAGCVDIDEARLHNIIIWIIFVFVVSGQPL